MKIAVITLKDSPNYGGILQAYALQKAIEKLGHNCDLIDFITPDFKLKFTFFGWPKNMRAIYWIYKKVQYPLMIIMMKKMMPFYRRMNLTRKFVNPLELGELNDKYDAFVTGSDQVWACDLNCFDDSYFLSFVNKDKLKIAYAASLGRTINMLKPEEKKFIASNLKRLDKIAFREESGNEVAKVLAGRTDTTNVLDPTLLLNKSEWLEVAYYKPRKAAYILCYLMQSKKNDTEALKFAKKIAKERNLKLVKICRGLTSILWGETLYVPTVEEWLGLYANASYIVTNSFHGVAFSVNFNKNFTAFVEGDIKSGRNSRLNNICTALDLSDRIKIVGEDMNIDISDINYSKVNVKLNELRKESIQYLVDSLNIQKK